MTSMDGNGNELRQFLRMVASSTRRFRHSGIGRAVLPGSVVERVQDWYVTRTTDVFLISFPKCGRTWLRLMVGKALEFEFGLRVANPMELESFVGARPGIPLIAVTHDDDPHYKRPAELNERKSKYRGKRVLFLVRDPRDVVVSAYFQRAKRRDGYGRSLKEHVRDDVGSLATIIRFYNIWAEHRTTPRGFLLVRYEDLHSHAADELRRILDFVGLGQVSDAAISKAVEYAAFDNMRRLELSNAFQSERLAPADRSDPESYKTREGRVGSYTKYLDQDDLEYLEQKIAAELDPFYSDYRR